MAKKGKYLKKKAKRNAGWKKGLLIFLAVVLVLIACLAAFGVAYYRDLLGHVSRAERQEQELSDRQLEEILGFVPETLPESETTQPAEAKPEPTESKYGKTGKIVNIMLVGQAMRENEESKLSDTMILVTVNKETKTVALTSFMRDMYVQLPNFKNHVCGMQRINVAYNLGWRWAGDLGGMEMLNQLILENFGVEVDHNVEVNFESFKSVIDLMGGVTLELSEDEANYLNKMDTGADVTFTAGTHTLKGDAALWYARMRKTNGSDSDFNRTARQRKLITVLLKRCMKMSISEIDSLLKTVLPMVLTDMTDEEITTLMMELLPLLPELTIESHRIPIDGSYYGDTVQIGGMDAAVLKVDVEANREYLMGYCEEAALSADAE